MKDAPQKRQNEAFGSRAPSQRQQVAGAESTGCCCVSELPGSSAVPHSRQKWAPGKVGAEQCGHCSVELDAADAVAAAGLMVTEDAVRAGSERSTLGGTRGGTEAGFGGAEADFGGGSEGGLSGREPGVGGGGTGSAGAPGVGARAT